MSCGWPSFGWLSSPTRGFAEGAEIGLTIAFFAATLIVVIGLIGEYREDKKGSWWAPHAFLAEMFVLAGVAGELFFEGGAFWYSLKLHALDETVITKAQTDASSAVREAARLGVTYKNLDSTVEAQKESVDKAVGEIKDSGKTLTAARDETVSSASKVQASLDAAREAQNELVASVSTISELRQQIHDLTTKRVLTEQQVKDLTKLASQFAKVQFDMAANHDSDSPYLSMQIGVALKNAGWEWVSRTALDSLHFGDLPNIGSAFTTGLQVHLCKSKESSLAPAVNAVYTSLKIDGFDLMHDIFPDNNATSRNEDCGVMHLVVGSRL
jgi:hypothetical protein